MMASGSDPTRQRLAVMGIVLCIVGTVLPSVHGDPARGAIPTVSSTPKAETPVVPWTEARHFVAMYRIGPRYLENRPPREQSGFAEHAAYMRTLSTTGVVLVGGPLFDGSTEGTPVGVLLILTAKDDAEARRIAENDPAVKAGLTELTEIRSLAIATGAWCPKG